MPNAAASLDADFGFQAAARRKPTSSRPATSGQGSSKPRKSRTKAGRSRGAIFDSVPRYGAIAISVLIGVGIVVNALLMQHGHHPAPLFGAAATEKGAGVKAMPAKPLPRAEVPQAPAASAEASVSAEVVEAPVRPAAKSSAAKTARGDDAIARLLGGDASPVSQRKAKPASDKVASGKAGTAKQTGEHDGQGKHRARED